GRDRARGPARRALPHRVESRRALARRSALPRGARRRALVSRAHAAALRHHRHRLHRLALPLERQPLRPRVLPVLPFASFSRRNRCRLVAARRALARNVQSRAANLWRSVPRLRRVLARWLSLALRRARRLARGEATALGPCARTCFTTRSAARSSR